MVHRKIAVGYALTSLNRVTGIVLARVNVTRSNPSQQVTLDRAGSGYIRRSELFFLRSFHRPRFIYRCDGANKRDARIMRTLIDYLCFVSSQWHSNHLGISLQITNAVGIFSLQQHARYCGADRMHG